MTVDKMAEMIAADPEEFKELIPLLWSKVSNYLFKMAANYIRNYGQLCDERGVELGDLKSGCLSRDTTVQELREVYFGNEVIRKPPAPRAGTLTEWAALERERRRKQQ